MVVVVEVTVVFRGLEWGAGGGGRGVKMQE